MSNIVKSSTKAVVSGNVVVPNFTQNLGDEPRRLKISVKRLKTKDGKKSFLSVKGYMRIACYDGDEFIGNNVKKIDVHFKKDAFKGCVLLSGVEDLKSGYLYVRAKGLQLPSVHKVELDENGKSVYPSIWIKSDIIGLQAFVASQASLDVDDIQEAEVVDDASGEVEFDTTEDFEQYEKEDKGE